MESVYAICINGRWVFPWLGWAGMTSLTNLVERPSETWRIHQWLNVLQKHEKSINDITFLSWEGNVKISVQRTISCYCTSVCIFIGQVSAVLLQLPISVWNIFLDLDMAALMTRTPRQDIYVANVVFHNALYLILILISILLITRKSWKNLLPHSDPWMVR